MKPVLLLTVPTGPGYAASQPDPRASLGGYASRTRLELATYMHNLFGSVDRAHSDTGDVVHRTVVVANLGDSELAGRRIWISEDRPGGSVLALALDPLGVRPLTDLLSARSDEEDMAPPGVTFTAPRTEADALATGSLPPDHGIALHLRRSTPAGVPQTRNDRAILSIRP